MLLLYSILMLKFIHNTYWFWITNVFIYLISLGFNNFPFIGMIVSSKYIFCFFLFTWSLSQKVFYFHTLVVFFILLDKAWLSNSLPPKFKLFIISLIYFFNSMYIVLIECVLYFPLHIDVCHKFFCLSITIYLCCYFLNSSTHYLVISIL